MRASHYKRNNLLHGYSRVELLIQVYNHAIMSVERCALAYHERNQMAYGTQLMEIQKSITTLHEGIRPESGEVATNVMRLLLFVTDAVTQHNFDAARKILETLRDGFEAIREEANELEKQGKIPDIRTESASVGA